MGDVMPFPIHEYGAKPHQSTPQVCDRRVSIGYDIENQAGECVEHVRDGKALTAKGALLLRRFMSEADGMLRGENPRSLLGMGHETPSPSLMDDRRAS